jgi:hypothetical protein
VNSTRSPFTWHVGLEQTSHRQLPEQQSPQWGRWRGLTTGYAGPDRPLCGKQSWYSTDGKQPGKGFVVALDIARGLAYLHHRQVGHCIAHPDP